MNRLLIAGGGTGGHLFPGLAVAEAWMKSKESSEVLFIGSARGIEVREVPKAGFALELIPISGLRGVGLLGTLRSLLRIPLAFFRSLKLIRNFRPSAALSVGGYAAGPAVLAARVLGIPCFVMEQNSVAGFTNTVLAKFSMGVFTSFAGGGFPKKKTLALGNPVRAELLGIRETSYKPGERLRLLILGGSQGARALNEVMMALASSSQDLCSRLSVLHQTGKADHLRVAAHYEALGLSNFEACAFIDDMADAYRESDMLLCRSGATTVAELAVCGRPAIFVPFPFATDDHQTENAREICAGGGAILLPQDEMNVDALTTLLGDLDADRERLERMAHAIASFGKPNAADDIVECISQAVRGAGLHV